MKKTKAVKKEQYEATAHVLGKKYTAVGATAYDAIAALKPGNVKAKVVMSVAKGKQKVEKILQPRAAMMLFNSRGMTQQVWLKIVSVMFGDL